MNKLLLPRAFAGAFLFSTLTLAATSTHANAATEAARVNDKVITLDEVNNRLAEEFRANPSLRPTKKSVLEELIKREAAVQEAQRMKLENDPVVADRLDQVLAASYIDKKLQPEFEKMTISDAEAKTWYGKNPEIRTSHIFVVVAPDANSDDEASAQKKLNDVLSQIKSGKMSFAEAAQKNSEDPQTAMLGGDMDYRMKDRLDPAYYRAAAKLGKSGDITGPVRTEAGYELIRLTGKHAWGDIDRIRVKKIMIEDRRVELVDKLLNGLRQKAKVSINEKALN